MERYVPWPVPRCCRFSKSIVKNVALLSVVHLSGCAQLHSPNAVNCKNRFSHSNGVISIRPVHKWILYLSYLPHGWLIDYLNRSTKHRFCSNIFPSLWCADNRCCEHDQSTPLQCLHLFEVHLTLRLHPAQLRKNIFSIIIIENLSPPKWFRVKLLLLLRFFCQFTSYVRCRVFGEAIALVHWSILHVCDAIHFGCVFTSIDLPVSNPILIIFNRLKAIMGSSENLRHKKK